MPKFLNTKEDLRLLQIKPEDTYNTDYFAKGGTNRIKQEERIGQRSVKKSPHRKG